MNLAPTNQPRTFHFVTRFLGHHYVETIYQERSWEEALARLGQACCWSGNSIGIVQEALRLNGRVTFNTKDAVIIQHYVSL